MRAPGESAQAPPRGGASGVMHPAERCPRKGAFFIHKVVHSSCRNPSSQKPGSGANIFLHTKTANLLHFLEHRRLHGRHPLPHSGSCPHMKGPYNS